MILIIHLLKDHIFKFENIEILIIYLLKMHMFKFDNIDSTLK